MPFDSYRRPPGSETVQRASRPRFTTRHRPAPELPAPVLMLGGVSYRDRDGIWWIVREQRGAAGATPRLVFASPGRLWWLDRYPADWRALSTAALVALGAGA